jgi:hypothetical protein
MLEKTEIINISGQISERPRVEHQVDKVSLP